MQYKLLALQFPLWDCHTPLFLHKYCTQSFKKRFLSLKSQNRRVTAFQLASSADVESRSKENQQHPHCFNRNTASRLWEPIIPHAALTRHTSILHSGWVPKIKRQMSINWSKFPGGPPNWPHAGAFALWGDAGGACSASGRDSVGGGSPNRVYRRSSAGGSQALHGGHKLKQETFRLDKRNNLFPMKTIQHWIKLCSFHSCSISRPNWIQAWATSPVPTADPASSRNLD